MAKLKLFKTIEEEDCSKVTETRHKKMTQKFSNILFKQSYLVLIRLFLSTIF